MTKGPYREEATSLTAKFVEAYAAASPSPPPSPGDRSTLRQMLLDDIEIALTIHADPCDFVERTIRVWEALARRPPGPVRFIVDQQGNVSTNHKPTAL